MSILGLHVTFRPSDGRVIAPDTVAQRRMARAVLAAARPYQLLGFRCADTHAHLLFFGEEPELREATRRVLIATNRALRQPVPFNQPHFEPVFDQYHLDRAFRYLMGQDDHHGFAHDPFHDASNLPDLLGLRTLGDWTAGHVRARLPRIDRATLLAHLGTPDLDTRPLDVTMLDGLADAAAAAIGAPELRGNQAQTCTVRAAAVHLGREIVQTAGVGAPTYGSIATRLHLAPRTARKLAATPPDPAMLRAVRGQLRLRAGGTAAALEAGSTEAGSAEGAEAS